MEMGLLVGAAVLVAVIVAYYYTTRTKSMMEKSSNQANETVQNFSQRASNIAGDANAFAQAAQ